MWDYFGWDNVVEEVIRGGWFHKPTESPIESAQKAEIYEAFHKLTQQKEANK